MKGRQIMPNCFTLTPIGTNEPASLISVDEAMCRFFGFRPNEVRYFRSWFDIIGLGLACGKSFDELIDRFKDYGDLLAIVYWLKANYRPNAWAERGR